MKSPEKFIELLFCTLCIMIFFLSYGYLQEKLMTRPYGDKEEMFQYSAFLVLSNRVVAMFIALLMLGCRGEPIRNVAPLKNYVNVSISNFIATYCQYEALKYVSFPTQTLGKCGKMIPVLILGSLFHHKVYNWKDYAVAISVMVGCTLFLVTGEITSPINAPQDSPIGLLLLLAYLFADGFTSTFQEKLFKGYSMSIYNQMLYVNTSSAFLSIIGNFFFPFQKIKHNSKEIFSYVSFFFSIYIVLLANSTFYSAIIFAYQNFDILIDAFLLSLCASLGNSSFPKIN